MESPGDARVPAAKATLRSRMLAMRASFPEEQRAAASGEIRRRLERLPELAGARTVLAYAAFGSEVDLDPFLSGLARAGVGVFLPWVDGDRLQVARVTDFQADLEPGWRGTREPRAVRRRPARVDRLEAVIAPGLAFDRHGARLGYGGGHFDRLLAQLRPGTPVVGVAFEAQVVDRVPVEAHDRPVDAVCTEAAVHRTTPS